MTYSKIAFSIVIALSCMIQTGCLLSHSNHVVLRQDEPLQQLTFESEQARNIYEAKVENSLNDESNTSQASFGIPFIVGLEQSKKVSESGVRNDVATQFDISGDRHISDYEASLKR
jgi:hypothetical protein